MLTHRGLVFIVPFLLAGCTACPHPGWPSKINERCFYVLQVTHVDAARNEVKAKIHPDQMYPSEKGYGYGDRNEEFSFRVKDIDKLVATNQLQAGDKAYVFGSLSGSSYLELYTEASTAQFSREIKYYKPKR